MNKEATKEYRYFLKKYLLPLLGIHNNNIEQNNDDFKQGYVVQENNYIYFSTDSETPYKLRHARKISEDNLSLAKNIIISFFQVSEHKMHSGGVAHEYYSSIQKESNYELSIQKGICTWILGKNNEEVEKLFNILEKWSVQTYEGKKVTMGFVINPYAKSNFDGSYGTFKDFIKDDFSAVFTDCIQSVIELDGNCEFCNYLSITENNILEECKLSKRLPIRFANVIQKYITGSAVGVFLLNNGDIILSKNQEIKFVKRNLKWLNLSYQSFYNSLKKFAEDNNINESLIENIYATTLDVSFSHVGGIIAVVNNIDLLTSEEVSDKLPILHKCDCISEQIEYENLYNYFKEQNEKHKKEGKQHLVISDNEIKKRILKRNAIDCFVKNKAFEEIDRKLRCELVSLDGACIIEPNGKVCSFGAIIKNDSGSSGGGRGAASKKLSRFGMAIKISTDGYIELYINGELKFSIK